MNTLELSEEKNEREAEWQLHTDIDIEWGTTTTKK